MTAAALFALCLQGEPLGAPIGSAAVVVNNVTGEIEPGQPGVPLRVGVDIHQDETVKTFEASATRLIFQDNTRLEIGATAQVVLDRLIFDPDPSKSVVSLSIAKGVARFITGNLPKSDYEIHTPATTVGVRGTVLDIEVAINGVTVVYVESGLAFVTANGITVVLHPGQSTTTLPGGVPSAPVNSTSPPQIMQLQMVLKQAELDNGNNNAAAITSITSGSTTGSSNCISPSAPGGRC